MAAGLQCLTATPPVLRHFLDLQQRGEKLPPPGSLMAHFSVLLGKMWSGRYSVLRPTEFKQTLGAYHSQFKDYRQVSVQLLTYLINYLLIIVWYKMYHIRLIARLSRISGTFVGFPPRTNEYGKVCQELSSSIIYDHCQFF